MAPTMTWARPRVFPTPWDVVDPDEGPDPGKDPLRFSNWMKRSATGAVMTGIAVGLKEALQPRERGRRS